MIKESSRATRNNSLHSKVSPPTRDFPGRELRRVFPHRKAIQVERTRVLEVKFRGTHDVCCATEARGAPSLFFPFLKWKPNNGSRSLGVVSGAAPSRAAESRRSATRHLRRSQNPSLRFVPSELHTARQPPVGGKTEQRKPAKGAVGLGDVHSIR